ncbi:MAG: sigma-70 family RNA polymerase sigma factor [Acidobacteriota bacterium]
MTSDSNFATPADRFPQTSWSAIRAAAGADHQERERALSTLIAAYWKPVYKHIRLKWNKSADDASDLTQSFFVAVMERNFFRSFDPERARFRTFLRACLDRFIANQEKAARRIKRGGDAQFLSLDFAIAEEELALSMASAETPDERFEKEWARSLFALALDSLRDHLESEGKQIHFQLFERYYLDDEETSYAMLGSRFGLSSTQVTNYLASARREFRRLLLDHLRALTSSDEEFRREARSLLGESL